MAPDKYRVGPAFFALCARDATIHGGAAFITPAVTVKNIADWRFVRIERSVPAVGVRVKNRVFRVGDAGQRHLGGTGIDVRILSVGQPAQKPTNAHPSISLFLEAGRTNEDALPA